MPVMGVSLMPEHFYQLLGGGVYNTRVEKQLLQELVRSLYTLLLLSLGHFQFSPFTLFGFCDLLSLLGMTLRRRCVYRCYIYIPF
jgi:hypothetical protein